MFNLSFLRLMLVTRLGSSSVSSYLAFVNSCLKAGVTSVQLREKSMSDDELFQFGLELKKITDDCGVPLIVNDRVEVAASLDAWGVHIGQDDEKAHAARMALGPDKVIGLSVNSFEELSNACSLPIDYIGVGAIFPTKSKLNVAHVWGLSELEKAVRLSPLPVVAIGGIDESSVQSVVNTGAFGVAMISGLHDVTCLTQTIQLYLSCWRN